MNQITKRRLVGALTILFSIVMILNEIMSLYFIDYFAGDCMSKLSRFGIIIFYSVLLFAGLLLIVGKKSSLTIYRISGLGLIIISFILLIIDINCWLDDFIFIHLVIGGLIGIISRNKTILGLIEK